MAALHGDQTKTLHVKAMYRTFCKASQYFSRGRGYRFFGLRVKCVEPCLALLERRSRRLTYVTRGKVDILLTDCRQVTGAAHALLNVRIDSGKQEPTAVRLNSLGVAAYDIEK